MPFQLIVINTEQIYFAHEMFSWRPPASVSPGLRTLVLSGRRTCQAFL